MCSVVPSSSAPEAAAAASNSRPGTSAATAAAAPVSSSVLDIQSCSPKALATALVSHRGKDEALQILQQAAKFAKEEAAQTATEETSSSTVQEEDLGEALLSEPFETSFQSPRLGRFHLQLYDHGLIGTKMNDASVKISVAAQSVSHVLIFPKPEDCKQNDKKKMSGCLVLLALKEPMTVQKKAVQQICFPLPSEKKIGPTGPPLGPAGDDIENDCEDATQKWYRIIQKALGRNAAVVTRVEPGRQFRSFQPPDTSTTTGGMPFVNCYLGVNDGALYPLKEGLLFFKPPKFLPRSELHSIACGRGSGGGQSSSRYVDMVVQLAGEESVEFTNIQREENGVLNEYIHNVLIPAMKEDAVEHGTSNDETGEEEEVLVQAVEDGDDEESEDEQEVREADDSDEDDDDEDFQDEDFEDEDEDGNVFGDEDDEEDDGFEVVRDEFATNLAKEKRKNQDDGSSTESEDDESKPRVSKRLRQQAGP